MVVSLAGTFVVLMVVQIVALAIMALTLIQKGGQVALKMVCEMFDPQNLQRVVQKVL